MFRKRLTLICFTQIIGLLVFLYGFFPLQSKISVNSTREDNGVSFGVNRSNDTCKELDDWEALRNPIRSKQAVDNVVLMVIDALRYDFVFSPTGAPNGRMSFLWDRISSGHVSGFEATVQPPTVTMPRIKAMTAGMVPAFVDVVLNFASSEFTEDNLISKARNAGRRLLFYGDDTWLRLFPAHFQDSDGVTSFIVSDYTEVDDNVTRHLPKALSTAGDWDMMILHYIGLDHIGHSSGPTSPLVSTKLTEMDEVIRKIYDGLAEKRRDFSIIVLGDHGMTDVGSHGGASHHETTVPMLFISSVDSDQSFEELSLRKVQQVDLTPTLAALLGVPIPVNSVGVILSSVVCKRTRNRNPRLDASELDLLHQNAIQMLRLHRLNAIGEEWKEVFNQYTALSNDHQTWLRAEFCRQPNANESAGTDDNIRTVETLKGRYRRMMEELRHRMIAASINYNEWALIAGMIIFIAALFFSIRACRKTVMRDLRTRNAAGRRCQLLLVGCLLHSVSFASSSFIEEEHFTWYFLFSTYLFVLLFDVFDAGLKTNSLFVWGKTLFCCVGILSFRLIRHWNPAGIKWRELESVSDWLTKTAASVIYGVTIYVIGVFGSFFVAMLETRGDLERLLLKAVYFLLFLYRANLIGSWSFAAVRTIYAACFLFAYLRRPVVCAVLLTSVLVKLTNLPLIFFLLLIQLMSTLAASPTRSPVEYVCSSYYLAMASYFTLGNSNSLGHVDVSSGYVGFGAYLPIVNGLLIIAHLYAGPMLITASAVSNFAVRVEDYNRSESLFLILALKGIPTAFYLVIACLQKYHLFVWSVFAPKLLYECAHMAVVCASLLMLQFFM